MKEQEEKKIEFSLEETFKIDNALSILEYQEGFNMDTLLKFASLRAVTEKEVEIFNKSRNKRIKENAVNDVSDERVEKDSNYVRVTIQNGVRMILTRDKWLELTEEFNLSMERKVTLPDVKFDLDEFTVERYEQLDEKKREKRKITLATPAIIKDLKPFLNTK